MSLKAFHIFFIAASIALAFGCGVWAVKNYLLLTARGWIWFSAWLVLVPGSALIVYERYFLKKLKNISYL